MPKPSKGPRLGAGPHHERKLLANLAKSLIEHQAITTTEAKARRLQPYIEKLITKALRGDIHNRRMVARKLSTQVSKYDRGFDAVYTPFDVIAPKIDANRKGGYTRIVKLAPRRGDNAPMVQISLVLEKVTPKAKVKPAATAAKASGKAEAEEAPVKEAPVKEAEVADEGEAPVAEETAAPEAETATEKDEK